MMESLDPIFQDARPTDLVIPVMGPPGVGKSTFINSLCGRDAVKVGNGLRSCTERLKAVVLEPTCGPYKNHRLVLVDTPPFNSTTIPDSEILHRVADWLALSYKKNMKLAGVVYLFESSQEPLTLGNIRDRELFRKICGNEALAVVVVGATKWEQMNGQAAQERIEILEGVFWGGPSRRICQVKNTYDGAWDIVNRLAQKRESRTTLQIQRELVDQGRHILDTEAGRYVRMRRKSGNISLARRILMFFSAKLV